MAHFPDMPNISALIGAVTGLLYGLARLLAELRRWRKPRGH